VWPTCQLWYSYVPAFLLRLTLLRHCLFQPVPRPGEPGLARHTSAISTLLLGLAGRGDLGRINAICLRLFLKKVRRTSSIDRTSCACFSVQDAGYTCSFACFRTCNGNGIRFYTRLDTNGHLSYVPLVIKSAERQQFTAYLPPFLRSVICSRTGNPVANPDEARFEVTAQRERQADSNELRRSKTRVGAPKMCLVIRCRSLPEGRLGVALFGSLVVPFGFLSLLTWHILACFGAV